MTEHEDIKRAKRVVREHVWKLLDRERASPTPTVHGKIPYFTGVEAAARRLAGLPQWQAARVLKANPDWPQLPVRVNALAAGKVVYMAVPRLADIRPFFHLDPKRLHVPLDQAAVPEVAAMAAPKVDMHEVSPIDLVICGSVAVSADGTRIGKGAGYSDIEVALLAQAGLLGPNTVIATTVHDLQVINEPLPATNHDFTVDLIVTPSQAINCPPSRRPRGLSWTNLVMDKIATIPLLAALAAERLKDSPDASDLPRQTSMTGPGRRYRRCARRCSCQSERAATTGRYLAKPARSRRSHGLGLAL